MAKSYSRQAVFDRTYQHHVLAGKPFGYSSGGTCIYGQPGDEHRCSIGVSDEAGVLHAYDGSEEGSSVQLIEAQDLEAALGEGAASDALFLSDLQDCHDDVATQWGLGQMNEEGAHQELGVRYRELAEKYGLTVPEPTP